MTCSEITDRYSLGVASSQGKTEDLLQIIGDQREITTKCSVESWIGSREQYQQKDISSTFQTEVQMESLVHGIIPMLIF